ncbi:NmrA family NAD(P)-binding protein [Chitinophaga sp. OAE865]|uniref:NmrA family NAD(P)-binding protein n=1 Tax=Chitinophaga sp. OAE865 TaxID=2817898 RepID=UPI001AE8DA87
MKIVVTGSIGNIGKPLVPRLVANGHQVTVITSKQHNEAIIENMGAKAVTGSVEDVNLLTGTFAGADIVYTMVPSFFGAADLLEFYRSVGENYGEAIRESGVQRVINLSSFGAHLNKGTGVILGAHYVEEILNKLENVQITHMRPTSFYYNLLAFADMIRNQGSISINCGGNDVMQLVHPDDIAAAIAEEVEQPGSPRKIRYVMSDERTCNEIAAALGKEIGMPDLEWRLISDEEAKNRYLKAGVPSLLAQYLTEIYSSLHNGKLAEDLIHHRPEYGKIKLEDYAREFAVIYNGKK